MEDGDFVIDDLEDRLQWLEERVESLLERVRELEDLTSPDALEGL
jgi:hypothetical protein